MSETAAASPSDIETERVVLGAILSDQRAMNDAKDILNPIYFADPVHRSIVTACLNLVEAKKIVAPVTVVQVLVERDEIDIRSGSAYLADLAVRGTVRGLRGDVFRLQDLYLRRVLISEARQMIERASAVEGKQVGFEVLSATVARLQELRYKVAKFMGGF